MKALTSRKLITHFKEVFMKNKLISLLLVTTMAASLIVGCGSSKTEETKTETAAQTETAAETTTDTAAESAAAEAEITKPEKITIMADSTLVTQARGRDAFEKKWEELTGIELEIIQPDHDAYYDVLGQTLASGDWPDVILLGSTYYPGYASEGVLWDMTEAYDNSELKASGRIVNEGVVEGMKLNGSLYGMSPARGNGCVTYVKQAWLDNCGLTVPTNYAEYLAMIEAFTTGDPDGNGTNGDTYAVSAAGLIGNEDPYVNYLPEFYQDAYPSFYMKDDGTWADGFAEESMKGALERMKEAYEAGYIDKESLTNGTKDCRNKFYEDKFGVFTYWAGDWAGQLKNNLEANELPSDLVAMKPIAEIGTYIERIAPAWCITEKCENPEGVFKYFIETMLDGGDVQFLWTYGVEGTHWSTAAEEVCGKTYAEGEFHFLEDADAEGAQYTKNHIAPLLAIATLANDPTAVSAEVKNSADIFNTNSHMTDLVVSTEEMSQYNGDLMTLKKEIIAQVVTQGMSVEDGMAKFKADGGEEWSNTIVESLNR